MISFLLLPLCLASLTPTRLQDDLQVIANAAPARVGVFAKNLTSGEEAFTAPDEPFPMQSTFKLPVAIALLHAAECRMKDLLSCQGKLRLTYQMTLTAKDVRSGPSNGIGARIGDKGLTI